MTKIRCMRAIYGFRTVKKGVMYPAASLTGTGTIQGHAVKCVSPEYLVKFHTGYELDESDFKDVYALHKRFGIALPSEYEKSTS